MRKKVALNTSAVWLLRLIGLWYPERNHQYYTKYRIYSLGYFCLYIIHVATMAIHLCGIYNDIEAFSASFYILSIKLIGVYKVIYILNGLEFSKNLVVVLDKPIYQPKNEEQTKLENSLFGQWKIRCNFLLLTVFNTVLFLNVSPIIDGISKRKLPFSSWYPFDYKPSPIYEIIYIYQLFASIYAGCINVGADVFASQILTNISIQCELLANSLENLGERDVEDGVSVEARMNKKLIECVQHHRAIIKYSKRAEMLFNWGVFAQFSASCIIMCLNLLQMSWLSPRSGEFLALSVYQTAIGSSLLTYCWHGNLVIYSSSKIPMAAYNSPWFEFDENFRKHLIFFMLRTQKPIVIYTLNFFSVSLGTFVSILRSSYSYYTVLRTVHEPE